MDNGDAECAVILSKREAEETIEALQQLARAASEPEDAPAFGKALERYETCKRQWEHHHGAWETERLEKARADLLTAARASQPPAVTREQADAYCLAAAGMAEKDARDAARYRWLRDPENFSHDLWLYDKLGHLHGAELDRAIDDASTASTKSESRPCIFRTGCDTPAYCEAAQRCTGSDDSRPAKGECGEH